METNLIGVVILAAGESARLGEPKQLLRFQGETLLRRSVRTALAVSDKIVVTLGARIAILQSEIADLPIKIVENKDWKSGMSGSLKIGLKTLIETNENLDAVLALVCDQPFVNADLLAGIIARRAATEALIVACEYQNTRGVPALFDRRLFPEILALDSATGAKHLIGKHREQTAVVAFPEGAFDIDTPEDYERLITDFT